MLIPGSREGGKRGNPEAGDEHKPPKIPVVSALRLAGCPLAALCSSVFHQSTGCVVSTARVVSRLNSSFTRKTRTEEREAPNLRLPSNRTKL